MITETATELLKFFSGFGIPAYTENTLPDDAELPYITYSLVFPDWRTSGSISASIWYSGTSFKEVFAKADEISNAIGEGIRLPVVEGGCVYLSKDSPFAQEQPTQSDTVKAVSLNIGIQAICK